MTDRLSSFDASFLYMERPATVMHAGSVMVFAAPEGGFGYHDALALVTRRIATEPRLRQRIREVPGRLGNPVWVDDESFDLGYHVRQAALPKPGGIEQLQDFVARIMPRELDRSRPLWELYVVEGLTGGRFAIVTKTHHAMVDARHPIDVAQVVLTERPESTTPTNDLWRPTRAPSSVELVGQALLDSVMAPRHVLDTMRGGVGEIVTVGTKVGAGLGSLLRTVVRGAARPAPLSPLNAVVGGSRRYLTVDHALSDYRTARNRLVKGGGPETVSINDIVLATVAGALRGWLLTRGEAVHSGTVVRALVPVSVVGGVDACLVDLPVGESGAPMRVHQIAFAMRQQIDGGKAVRAQRLVGLAGFAPPTLHSMGARLGNDMSRRLFNVIVTNSPGPQHPLYAGEAMMSASYPVIPLATGQALSIGLTSYDGGIYYGLNADRIAMSDLDVLAEGLDDALAELTGGPISRPVAVPVAQPAASTVSQPAARPRRAAGAKEA